MPFGKTPSWLLGEFFERNGFHLAALPSRPDGRTAALMVVLLQGSAISSKDLKRRNRWVLGLSDRGWSLGKMRLKCANTQICDLTQVYVHSSHPRGLLFSLTHTINCDTFLRPRLAFPNYVRRIQLATDWLQSRSVSRIADWRMRQSSIMRAGILKLLPYISTSTCFYFVIMEHCE